MRSYAELPPPPRIRLGSHPELLHLHSELSRRRDKRIELAARRRSYEIANILKRRRAEENAVWSWWMVRFFPYVCERVLMSDIACTRRTADYHGCRDESKAQETRARPSRYGKTTTRCVHISQPTEVDIALTFE
jgi:hypothetical protein